MVVNYPVSLLPTSLVVFGRVRVCGAKFMAQINYLHSRRNSPIAKKVGTQPSKETGFLGAFWLGDKDGLKKPGFSSPQASNQPKKPGF